MTVKTKNEIVDGSILIEFDDVVIKGVETEEPIAFAFIRISNLMGTYGTIYMISKDYGELIEEGVYSLQELCEGDTPLKRIALALRDSPNIPKRHIYDMPGLKTAMEIKICDVENFFETLRFFVAPSFLTGGASLDAQDRIFFEGMDFSRFFDGVVVFPDEDGESYKPKKENKENSAMYR
jgi:hypothetical protein